MRALGGHGGLRGHAGVANAMRAGHGGQVEARRHVARQAHLLVDLDAVAAAHDAKVRHLAQRRARLGHLPRAQMQHRVGIVP